MDGKDDTKKIYSFQDASNCTEIQWNVSKSCLITRGLFKIAIRVYSVALRIKIRTCWNRGIERI